MTTTISKGKMFACTTVVDDTMLQAMKECKGNAEFALQAGAEFWHSGILPKHFVKGAGAEYGYAPRSSSYLKQSGKRGKPALVFSGSMRRELLGRSAIQRVGSSVNLKMYARALNLAPSMPENSDDLKIRHKKRGLYPNLKREIKAMTPDDKERVASVVAAELEFLFRPTDHAKLAGKIAG